MQINLPQPSSSYSPTLLSQMFDHIRRAFLNVVSADEAAPYVHLLSPAGKVYRLTVSDAGVVTTILVGTA